MPELFVKLFMLITRAYSIRDFFIISASCTDVRESIIFRRRKVMY